MILSPCDMLKCLYVLIYMPKIYRPARIMHVTDFYVPYMQPHLFTLREPIALAPSWHRERPAPQSRSYMKLFGVDHCGRYQQRTAAAETVIANYLHTCIYIV